LLSRELAHASIVPLVEILFYLYPEFYTGIAPAPLNEINYGLRSKARFVALIPLLSCSEDHDNNSYTNKMGDEKNQRSKGGENLEREDESRAARCAPASRVCFIAYDSR
jgi:hypothetical protein